MNTLTHEDKRLEKREPKQVFLIVVSSLMLAGTLVWAFFAYIIFVVPCDTCYGVSELHRDLYKYSEFILGISGTVSAIIAMVAAVKVRAKRVYIALSLTVLLFICWAIVVELWRWFGIRR